MIRKMVRISLFICAAFHVCVAAGASPTFICQEPGGKRLIRIDDKQISKETDSGKTLLYIDGDNILADPSAAAMLVVDDNDIRHSVAGVKIAVFDGENLRHGNNANGKVLFNYHHPDICPDAQSNRIYSIEGDALSKQQLVAGLYLLKPEWFKLSDEETAAQQKAIKDAGAEQDKKDQADQVAGKWDMLNSSGIMEKAGSGTITVSPKQGDAYPVNVDLSKGQGPQWTGVGVYKLESGDKNFYTAYGTPKTIAMCVYEIDGGSLTGAWYPWYINGEAKNTGSEILKGPDTLDGEYTIQSAKAPFTQAAYSGTVIIKPMTVVGASDDAKPYSIIWTIGGAKINGIGIKSGKFLYASTGTGTDVSIAKFKIENGNMTSSWFKLGSTELGQSAATNSNP